MKYTTLLAKISVVSFLSATAVSTAYAADANISCPTVDTLNKVIAQGNGIPDAFTDQGFTYGNANSVSTRGGKALSFSGVRIPTIGGDPLNKTIQCVYNFQYAVPNAPTVANIVANVAASKFKGVTGDWTVVPAKSSCYSNSATGCTFTNN
jgi:hypothetical protein